MKQLPLIDITPPMQKILDIVREWGGSITDMALHNNIQVRGWSKSKQSRAIRDCIERGYLRRDPDDLMPLWNHYQEPTWDEWLNGPQEVSP